MAENNINNSRSVYHSMISLLHTFLFDIKKSIMLFLTCIVIAVALLFTYNYKQSKIYKSSFTVSYEELIRKVHGDRLDKLNTLVEKGYTDKVSSLLHVDNKVASSIIGIKGVNILGEDLVDDLNTDTIPFVVHVYMTDTVDLKKVQEGILLYLETGNEYLAELSEFKKKEVGKEIEFLENQLRLLDSTKLAIIDNDPQKRGVSNAEVLQNIYELSYVLFEKKQKLLRKKQDPSSLHIIEEALLPIPKGHSYILLSLIAVVLGTFIYLVIRYLFIPAIKYK